MWNKTSALKIAVISLCILQPSLKISNNSDYIRKENIKFLLSLPGPSFHGSNDNNESQERNSRSVVGSDFQHLLATLLST